MFRRFLQTLRVQQQHQRQRSRLVRPVQRPLPEVLGAHVRRQLREVRKLVLRRRDRTKELSRFFFNILIQKSWRYRLEIWNSLSFILNYKTRFFERFFQLKKWVLSFFFWSWLSNQIKCYY